MAKIRTIQLYRGTTAQNDAYTGSAGELTMDTTTNELRLHNGSTVGGKVVSAPTGMIAPFAGRTAPEGWLMCDGSEISRTDYTDLFAVIGTIYGSGDDSTTFNLPTITNSQTVVGVAYFSHDFGTTTYGSAPKIIGDLPNTTIAKAGWSGVNGAFSTSAFSNYATIGSQEGSKITFDASRCSSAYSRTDDKIIPNGIYLCYVIKY